MDAQTDLPLDLIHHEILTRTSLETSASFRLVSNASRDFTYTSLFKHLFNQRTKTITGYFVQSSGYISQVVPTELSDSKQPQISLQFIPFSVEILAASKTQGLLFCMDRTSRSCRIPPRFCVCKPSTRQWRLLPNPKTKYVTAATAIMVLRSKPLWFKIVRFSQAKLSHTNRDDDRYIRYRCEVFDSNTWSWKQLEDLKLDFCEFFKLQPGVSVCGAVHWLTAYYRVVAFDVERESCTTFTPPQEIYNTVKGNRFSPLLVVCEYKGKLATLFQRNKESNILELWVMEDYQNRQWFKEENLDTEALRRRHRFGFGYPIGLYDDETAVIKDSWELILYKFKNGVSRALYLPCSGSYFEQVFPFQTDIVPCDLLIKKH